MIDIYTLLVVPFSFYITYLSSFYLFTFVWLVKHDGLYCEIITTGKETGGW